MVLNFAQEVLQFVSRHILVIKVFLIIVLAVTIKDFFQLASLLFFCLPIALVSAELLLADFLEPVRLEAHRLDFFNRCWRLSEDDLLLVGEVFKGSLFLLILAFLLLFDDD